MGGYRSINPIPAERVLCCVPTAAGMFLRRDKSAEAIALFLTDKG